MYYYYVQFDKRNERLLYNFYENILHNVLQELKNKYNIINNCLHLLRYGDYHYRLTHLFTKLHLKQLMNA